MKRIAHFTTGQMVFTLGQSTQTAMLPKEEEMLRQAIVTCLRDYTRHMGYLGIAINLDLPHSDLLTLLAVEALGASKVHGISFTAQPHNAPRSLGIEYVSMPPFDGEGMFPNEYKPEAKTQEALRKRVESAQINSYADQEGLILISPLSRHQILLGEYTLYAENSAKLLPFGKLYEMDLYLLSQHLSEERVDYFGILTEPERPELDRILHATIDKNCASSDLISAMMGELQENDIRYVQRRVLCSAEAALQIPPSLHVEAPDEDLLFPICHRLND